MDATPKTINMEELDKCLVELKELIRGKIFFRNLFQD